MEIVALVWTCLQQYGYK